MSANYRYEAYQIVIESELEFPELPLSSRTSDVLIRFGAVPEKLDRPTRSGPIYEGKPGIIQLNTLVARILIADGVVTIDRNEGVSDHDLRIVVLRPVMGALFHQLGLFALHGSAVATERGAVVFCGHSGAGKSTLAAAFHQRDYRVLADDQTVIDSDKTRPVVRPTYPSVYLRPDSLEALEREKVESDRVRQTVEKYRVSIGSASGESVPLRQVYFLQPGNVPEVTVCQMDGRTAFRELPHFIYRLQFAEAMGCEEACFRGIAGLFPHVRFGRISRPYKPFQLDEIVRLVERDNA
jgi:hypothetical protein